MRSTWLGLSVGILSLIGCNALWQGYLSPLDDPGDASVANSDLTGVPPDDLTGADLTGVDLAMTPTTKLCGYAVAPSGTFRYSSYQTVGSLGTINATKLAVIDIDKDGRAEIAASTNNPPVNIFKLVSNGSTCTYNTPIDCNTTNSIWELRGLQIDNNVGAFIVVKNNNNSTAFATCSEIPVIARDFTSPKFSNSPSRREATVPPIGSTTNGIFSLFEKGTDSVGDRINSVKLDANLSLVSVNLVASLSTNTPYEPRNTTGARIDDTAPDGILDAISMEADDAAKLGRLQIYNNNQSASPSQTKASYSLGASSNSLADANRIVAAKWTPDTYDDAIAIIDGSTPKLQPYIITSGPTITPKAQISLSIPQAPTASEYRTRILFADLNQDGIDELITFNSTSVQIYTYTASTNTLSLAQTITGKSSYTISAIALGFMEKSVSATVPDIFVISGSSTTYEIGVFRHVPIGVATQ